MYLETPDAPRPSVLVFSLGMNDPMEPRYDEKGIDEETFRRSLTVKIGKNLGAERQVVPMGIGPLKKAQRKGYESYNEVEVRT